MQYAPFQKKTGDKTRTIHNPKDFLKFVQGRMNDRILSKFLFPSYVIGGIRGRNPLQHPATHIKAPVVVTIDVKDCFPNIRNNRVFDVWKNQLKCSAAVASLATKLTTFEGHLPLGAPTSNALANIALLPCVKNICRIAQQYGFKISQYVDDLALSGVHLPDNFISEVVREFSRHGFTINRKKIKVMRSGEAQLVTKKNVNRIVSIPRTKREQLKTKLHLLTSMGKDHPAYAKFHASVKGSIHAMKKLHPAQAEKMLERIGKNGASC